MKQSAILVCREPRGARWQLGDLPLIGECALLGWRLAVAPAEAGVPAEVAKMIAGALTATFRVAFACSKSLRPRGTGWIEGEAGDWACVSGGGGRFKAFWRRESTTPVLLATRRSEIASRLFDDPVYPWWLQGQVALLWTADAPLPAAESIAWATLLDEGWISRATALGAQGAVRPGVDGDVAGLWVTRSALMAQLLNTLEERAGAAGFAYQVLSEEAFAQALAADAA
ncbi:MAG: hypothetical protein JNK31_08150 [Candidatus Competibacter sp.]|nr:hypothetical protein [Candidatus Competibacter sp.]